MSFLSNTRPGLFAIALSSLLAACGGGGSSAQAPEQKVWVEGYAVKGAIDGGLVSIWNYEPGSASHDWVQIGNTVRTNEQGEFRISVPEAYATQPLKVILQSDTQTSMRCDVQATCTTPSGVSVGFGDWFWPGNNLELKSLVVPASASEAVVLTPLVTLAFEKFLKSPEGGAAHFQALLRDQEERFGLAPGALTNRPIDLAASDLSDVQAPALKTALLNIAFLSLVNGEEWKTLGDVILAARKASEPTGDLPLSIEDSPVLSIDLLVAASVNQAEALEPVLKKAGVLDAVLAATLASLEETMGSTMPETPPASTTDPEAVPQPEPQPEPTPGPDPTPQQPGPAPDPTPNPGPGTKPTPEPDPTPKPDPGPTPAPNPGTDPKPTPEPVTGYAKMSWTAPATRVNGESLAMGEIDKYIVKYGKAKSIEDRVYELTVEDGQAMEYTIEGLTEGTWYFAIKTVDTNGLASEWSASASKTISR